MGVVGDARRRRTLDLRNHGVYGERTDEIAARLEAAARGAEALVVQGGINDVVQRRPVEEAARNLAGMVERGRRLGLRVALVDVLPWNNGDGRAASDIVRLNTLIGVLAEASTCRSSRSTTRSSIPTGRTACATTGRDDGDHPSIEGHRLLGERAFRRF